MALHPASRSHQPNGAAGQVRGRQLENIMSSAWFDFIYQQSKEKVLDAKVCDDGVYRIVPEQPVSIQQDDFVSFRGFDSDELDAIARSIGWFFAVSAR